MPPRFIVGYDGEPGAVAALRFAAQLGRPLGATVEAIYVYPAPGIAYAEPFGGVTQPGLDELSRSAQRTGDAIVAEAPEADGRRALPGGSAPLELQALAREEHAALIAVGVTHRGPVGRVVPGSVAERLIHGAPCPVAIVPPLTRHGPIATIGVAYDGRVEARRALRLACGLAERLGAELVLMAAVKPGPRDGYLPREPEALDRALGSPYRHALSEAATRVPEGIRCSLRLLPGPPGPAIAGACSTGVDLLVTGSRGHAALHNAMAGSTSRHLADHAPCPVLVVPWGAEAASIRAFGPETELAAPA